jgi:DNA-binding protein HU-beta
MNRRELVTAIAAHTDTEAKTVDAVVRGFTDVVSATVAKGDPVVLTGFAKFAKIQTKARMGRNPATGEAIKIKASKKARITPLKSFKDVVLGAAPAPKLTKAAPAKMATKTTTSRPIAARKTTTAAKAPATRSRATKTTAAKAPATRSRTAKTTAPRRTATRTTKG